MDYNFYDLQLYLGLQLLDDVTQDEQELIGRFMRLYYGPAVKFMYQASRKIVEAHSCRNSSFVPSISDDSWECAERT